MTSGGRFNGRTGRPRAMPKPTQARPRPQWQAARAELDAALADARWTPCAEEPEAWLSHDPTDRELASMYCRDYCPVMRECLAYAQAHRPRFGVFGGRDFTEKGTTDD